MLQRSCAATGTFASMLAQEGAGVTAQRTLASAAGAALPGHVADQVAEHMVPGMVIEIVERNELIRHHWGFQRIKNLCEGIRGLGGEIALDDVAGTDLEERMIEVFRPRVLKANDRSGLDFISSLGTGAIVVAEHIESSEIATQAVKLGASELQGYWCDVLKEHEVPRILTPPGVAARNRQLQLAAA